ARREFENSQRVSGPVAAFNDRPLACRTPYRMVVVRKNLSVGKGERVLFEDVRSSFYLTNDWVSAAAEGGGLVPTTAATRRCGGRRCPAGCGPCGRRGTTR